MESEYEGFPGLVETDSGEMRYLLDQVTYAEYDGLFDRLETFENIRAKGPHPWPHKLTQQEYLYNALSALRYTCPQAWLFGIWRFNRTDLPSTRTRFYHIYHAESPRYPYTKVPGLPGNRRLPFHGLDMLLLTGNYQEVPSAFDEYKTHLWRMFKNFVHEYKMDELCEVHENTGKLQGTAAFSTG
ncbi:unnamed protein product [Dicrocoelium dendriticum]|nr:unnamed protein product [Dicrocoelium dendriticum]